MKGPEAYSASATTTVDGKPETMTMESTGKWLAADCGNLRPVAPPKK